MKSSLTATEFSAVFEAGRTSFLFPLKLIATTAPSSLSYSTIRTGFSVPKRLVKKAVFRNRLKRQMRAAFQKHEIVLRETFLASHTDYNFVFIYCDKKTDIPLSVLEDAILGNIKALVQSGKQ